MPATRTSDRADWRMISFDHDYSDLYCVPCAEQILTEHGQSESCPFPYTPDDYEHPEHCVTISDRHDYRDNTTDAPSHCANRECQQLLDQLLTRAGIAYVQQTRSTQDIITTRTGVRRRRPLPDGWNRLARDSRELYA